MGLIRVLGGRGGTYSSETWGKDATSCLEAWAEGLPVLSVVLFVFETILLGLCW